MIVDEDGDLEKSAYVTNLIVDDFSIYMENTGGDASWLKGKNEIHNIRIHLMGREGLLDCNQNENKWCCAAENPS